MNGRVNVRPFCGSSAHNEKGNVMAFIRVVITAITCLLGAGPAFADESRIERGGLESDAFDGNRIGVSPTRAYQVYLPRGYDETDARYPTLYFLHSFFEDEKTFFTDHNGKQRLDEAVESGALDGVIVVAADYNTPVGGGFYTPSPVTGDWLSFAVDDLVPHIDRTYRTIDAAGARGVFGRHAGGYGAIRFASRRPDVFGVVYAMHPVGTGHGNILMQSRPDWERLENIASLDDLKGDIVSEIFTIIYQANLPDPDRPPLFFDPPAKRVDGELVIDAALTEKLQQRFFLERHVGADAENLKKLAAFKFDWGRHDANQDHVYSNQFYSRKLNEFGVPHEAEEYNGGWGDHMFERGGRIETDVFPFFQRHLRR